MSQSDRGISKCRKSSVKEGDGSDLSLSGSQVSLVSRPRSVVGKASFRALSVSGPRVRRPMSALPAMSFSEITRDKRRPYSADSQLLVSSCHKKRNKFSTCFSLSADPMSLTHDIDTDADIEFSSSTLVSSQLSDQLGGAWMELELRDLYMGQSGAPHHSSSTDNGSDLLCCSDVSEEHTRSEKSLGEHIQAMARDQFHRDRGLCAHQASPFDKTEECVGIKVSERGNGEDPKKMSTKELHLRMVESGLISPSLSYTTMPIHQNSHGLEFGNSCSYDAKTNSETKATCQQKRFSQEENCHEFSSGDGVQNPICMPSNLWKQNHNIYPAACDIEEISFPKEHDIDSLGGDSSSSLNGLDSQRKGETSSKSLPIYSRQDDKIPFQWCKSEFGPVRFHQWVTDSSKASDISTSRDKSPSTFYCGVRLTHPENDKETLGHDCTVEEVSTDSEYSKIYSSPSDSKVEKEPSQSLIVPQTASKESATALENIEASLEKDSDGVMETGKDACLKDNMMSSDSQMKDVSDSSLIQNTLPSEESSTRERQNITPLNSDQSNISLTSRSENLKQIEKVCDKNSSEYKEHLADFKNGNISKQTQSNGKRISREGSSQKVHNQYLQTGLKRKSDLKLNSNIRRGGKNSSNNSNRSFTQSKEETFPGEAQTELLSWMAMCSEDLSDKITLVNRKALEETDNQSKLPQQDSGTSVNEDSPYHEIMTILRVLEDKEDESSLMRILNKRSEPRILPENSTFDMGGTEGNKVASSSGAELNSDTKQSLTQPSTNRDDGQNGKFPDTKPVEKSESNAMLSTSDINSPHSSVQGELRDLLTFLDAVDQSCSSVLQPRTQPIPGSSIRLQSDSSDHHNVEELLLMGRSDLAQEIVSLRLTLEDRDATINLLRAALREQKDSQTRQNAAHSKEVENRVNQVKTECEAAIKRHQKFIDQLIADKAALGQKCESLVQEVKDCEEKHAKALANLEGKHKVEMQRVKDITAATEKLKRERWVENKTQKIKELTVRGLEPELSRLTSQHEQEMSALRTLHAQELEQMEVRAARRASQQMETLREQLVQEKEEALTKEREMLRQRMEKQQLLFEEEGAEQRRRLVAEVRREQDRLATLEARLQTQFEERKRALEREAEQERERLRRDYADKVNELHRKQQNEILQYREALKAEKEDWMESYQQQQKQTLIQTTNEIRDQLKRERDREIEVVIERLENEATISREEREKLAESRLKRVREQLTSELRDVESALNSLKEKHAELRSQLQDKEDKLVSFEALNRSLHTQLAETRRISDQLSTERADLKQSLQAELSCEMESLRKQLADQHARHQQQLQILSEQAERERQTHQQELQQVFDRVKLAIAKKEEVVKVAKAKQKAAEEQTSHLQALLDHRRKESFLS